MRLGIPCKYPMRLEHSRKISDVDSLGLRHGLRRNGIALSQFQKEGSWCDSKTQPWVMTTMIDWALRLKLDRINLTSSWFIATNLLLALSVAHLYNLAELGKGLSNWIKGWPSGVREISTYFRWLYEYILQKKVIEVLQVLVVFLFRSRPFPSIWCAHILSKSTKQYTSTFQTLRSNIVTSQGNSGLIRGEDFSEVEVSECFLVCFQIIANEFTLGSFHINRISLKLKL